MSEFCIGDLVTINENVHLLGENDIFKHVISRVLEVKEDMLILGIHDRTLVVPHEFCKKCTKYEMEERINLFEGVLHRFLNFFGAKLFASKRGDIEVTLDEGESFYRIQPNHERIKGNRKRE